MGPMFIVSFYSNFQSQHAENNEKRRRTNIMILSITVVFFVSWLPLNVFNFLMDMYPEKMKSAISGRVSEKMSCKYYKIIVCICRYGP